MQRCQCCQTSASAALFLFSGYEHDEIFMFAEGISWLLYHIILARSSSCSLDLTFPSFPFSQQMVFLILRWWTFLVIIMDLIVEMISCYTGEIAMKSCH